MTTDNLKVQRKTWLVADRWGMMQFPQLGPARIRKMYDRKQLAGAEELPGGLIVVPAGLRDPRLNILTDSRR